MPSLVAPILTFMYEPAVGPLASSTSARLMVTFTGCPVFRESRAATGSRWMVVLPPNPPPISMGTTFTADEDTPRTLAVFSPIWKWPCELHHTVSLPSGVHQAVALWGSM